MIYRCCVCGGRGWGRIVSSIHVCGFRYTCSGWSLASRVLFTLFFETGFLTEPGGCLPLPPVLGLQGCCAAAADCVGAGHMHSVFMCAHKRFTQWDSFPVPRDLSWSCLNGLLIIQSFTVDSVPYFLTHSLTWSVKAVVLNLWVVTSLGSPTTLLQGWPKTIRNSGIYIVMRNSSEITVVK